MPVIISLISSHLCHAKKVVHQIWTGQDTPDRAELRHTGVTRASSSSTDNPACRPMRPVVDFLKNHVTLPHLATSAR
jgi:hypothetical protein